MLDVEGVKRMIGWTSRIAIYDAIAYGFHEPIRLTPRTIRWDKRYVIRVIG